MLDLLIINPAAAHGIYGPLGNELIACEPPLWCRLIAGYIRDNGYSVKIIDAEAEQLDAEAVGWQIELMVDKPRLIAVVCFGHQPSASTQQMWGARQVLEMLDDEVQGFDIPTIIVGGHVAALPERTLAEEPVDYACNGEGPATILGLLKGRGPVPGLVWRDTLLKGRICQEPRAELPPLSELHGNAWDLLPMDRYTSHNWQCFGDLGKRKPYASIYTTLNCPYKCSFCCISAPFGNNRYLRRDPKDVVAEIKMLYEKYGVSTLKIVDEMFILTPSHYLAICDGIIDEGLGDKLNIWAYARVDTVKPDTLTKLRRAGFRWLALGIESGSKHVRDGTDKALKSDDIVGVVRQIQAADINVIGNYIFGLPDDDLASMEATLALSMECNTEFANFYCAMAYPGSRLYSDAIVRGLTLPSSWRGYSQHNDDCRPLDTEHVSAAQVLRFRDEAFITYFTNPKYLEMVERKFGAETLEHVKRMTQYKLKRKLLEVA